MKWTINEYNNWIALGRPINLEVTELYVTWSKIKSLGCLDNLTNLQCLDCSGNQLTSLRGIKNLTNLRILRCSDNQLTKLQGIESLTNLQILYCPNNQLTSLQGIRGLTNLRALRCYNNKLTSLQEIESLTNLRELYCHNNQLTLLRGIENFTNLEEIHYYGNPINYYPPNILRILDNLDELQTGQNIYNDSQNVHNRHLQNSIRTSVDNILKTQPIITDVTELILNDDILTGQTKSLLLEYASQSDVYIQLNVTFAELLLHVFNRIIINKDADEIKRILNTEMEESICKCFTGRISRLVNCLNGFDDLVNIKITDSEQMAQIISLVRTNLETDNKYSVELHKLEVTNRLTELGYDLNTINIWTENIE